MRERVIEDLLAKHPHARLLRYLAATPGGLDESYLTEGERTAAGEMREAGVVSSRGGKLRLSNAARATLDRSRSRLALSESDGSAERLNARLYFIREVTRVITGSRTLADLFRSSFAELWKVAEFDLAVAVILEQNLDVYLTRRDGLEDPLSGRFATEVKEAMKRVLDVSVGETDLIVRTNFAELPAGPSGDPYAHCISTVLRQENRAAGVLVLFRSDHFSPEAAPILEVLASQISIVLGNIRTTEKIQNLADTDELTGIWNKRWLRRQLPNEIDRARVYVIPLSLAMFDIDDFKEINDTFGHILGDVLLSELCGTVRETLRPPDALARFGGDEFAVVLPHSDIYGARAVADRILQRARALRLIVADGTTEVRCTVSVGIATYVPPTMTAAELIQRADERLYESKRLGKNRVSW
ncbi:MAG TPA: GGDEF domain-containing protein [Thermoanaerobaculia bacterium]|nr:GGDEF domain-containing protein [Thermoanaerobaculia bacterium]